MAGIQCLPFDSSIWSNLGIDLRASSPHKNYFGHYLKFFECKWVLSEPKYVDRDFHSEYASFYATSARGLSSNSCMRLHFFSQLGQPAGKDAKGLLLEAAEGSEDAKSRLQKSYLGFTVIRPDRVPTFGRTCLRCYPNDDLPREFPVAGKHTASICGVQLTVEALPWQEQDGGASACATIAMWSVLRSIGPLEGLANRTAAEITENTIRHSVKDGWKMPPSLHVEQVIQGFKNEGLAPYGIAGDLRPSLNLVCFSPHYFREYISILLRGRIPIVLCCIVPNSPMHEGHAVTVVGYENAKPSPNVTALEESFWHRDLATIYIHDDNFGPSMRHVVRTFPFTPAPGLPAQHATFLLPLREGATDADSERPMQGTPPIGGLLPFTIIAPTPMRIRMSPQELLKRGLQVQTLFELWARPAFPQILKNDVLFRDVALVRQTDYFSQWLTNELGLPKGKLGRLKFELQNHQPLPRFFGIIRIRTLTKIYADLLLDSTDSPHSLRFCGGIEYHQIATRTIERLKQDQPRMFVDYAQIQPYAY